MELFVGSIDTRINELPRKKFINSFSKSKIMETLTCLCFLRDNGVSHLTEMDCGRVITYFDTDRDNGLNYKE